MNTNVLIHRDPKHILRTLPQTNCRGGRNMRKISQKAEEEREGNLYNIFKLNIEGFQGMGLHKIRGQQ